MQEEKQNTQPPVEETQDQVDAQAEVEQDQADAPIEETTSEAVDVAELQKKINLLTQQNQELTEANEALRNNLVEEIPFPDFEEVLKQMKEQKMSTIDMQNAILSNLVLKFQLRGHKMATNAATSFSNNGRESQNGVSHKAQYSLNSLEAVKMMPKCVMEWLTEHDACAFVFGDTSWLSADEIAQKKANANTNSGWQGF